MSRYDSQEAWGNQVGSSIVGAGEAAIWDDTTLRRIRQPFAAGLLLDIAHSEPWYDYDQLASQLAG